MTERGPCLAYADPRLAAVYDTLNPGTEDYDFYLELAGATPIRVLDVGSGTGRFACALADRGHRVTGAEPAAGMMAVARARPGGEGVTWVESDAAGLALDTPFDLAVMTGHVFQVFLGDDEVRAALRNLHRHLAPGGRLALETRNPAVRDWDSWTRDVTHEDLDVPGLGLVQVHYSIAAKEGQFVAFDTHFKFAEDDVAVAPHTLRFMTRDELAQFLAEAGFAAVTWYGDYDRTPPGPDQPEIIAIAETGRG